MKWTCNACGRYVGAGHDCYTPRKPQTEFEQIEDLGAHIAEQAQQLTALREIVDHTCACRIDDDESPIAECQYHLAKREQLTALREAAARYIKSSGHSAACWSHMYPPAATSTITTRECICGKSAIKALLQEQAE